ncbi:18884_t:CDS:2 [Acaulospora morrowiae]|uniref:18884_t:CDS:1 n=1 Tax=Acaulospora morrowiae TaxID=94023 RepID=A0A9N9GCP6_9GLOM|nr:18884_t:CDS:2 [Acaulospora morrowiae]
MAFYEDLAEDLKLLYENRKNCDVKIHAGIELEEIYAHSLLLRVRSPYFRGALSQERTKNKDGYFIFKKPTISVSTFEVILKFIYCGIADLRELDCTEIFNVLIAADELGLQKFIIYIQKFLIENRANFLQEDPVRMLRTVIYYEAFDDLKKFCVEAILADPDILFGSNKFLALEENPLIAILKSDDLTMDEIEIWDCVIKWGMAQDPKLKSNVENFKDQDFKALEDRLHNFIPLIRFHDIPMEGFYLGVWPFKKILTEKLVNDILRCYMVPKAKPRYNVYPSRTAPISSTLINTKHLILFASWIDRKPENYTRFGQIPYKFKLLYRASQDGNNTNIFRQRCNNQGATIVVGKIQNSERLTGGYNPLSWNGNNQYKYSTESFIFSIDNCNNPNNYNLGRLTGANDNSAIYDHNSYGPTFGRGNDLRCQFNNCWYYNANTYTSIGLQNQYNITDWEVFKVEKKV